MYDLKNVVLVLFWIFVIKLKINVSVCEIDGFIVYAFLKLVWYCV